jgi:thiamine biosynthesis protein ThiI
MDKAEITREAQQLGSFEISTLPDQDCCQLFVPRHPATAASLDAVRQAEAGLDVDGLVSTAVKAAEDRRFASPPDREVTDRSKDAG